MLELDDNKLPTGRILPASELSIRFNELTPIETILQRYPTGLDDVFPLVGSDLRQPQLCFTRTYFWKKNDSNNEPKYGIIFYDWF